MNPIDFLLKPKSIALIGASSSEEKLGGVILKNLLNFKGKVYPVNPNHPKLMGLKAYPSFKDIPDAIDLVIVMRPAAEVPDILKEIGGNAKCVIISSSGFAEVGDIGLQNCVKQIGREIGLRILGPNCMGVYNPYHRLDTFFLPYDRLKRPKRGNVAVVSQSGAILSCIMSSLKQSNTGISKAIGYGNAIDIDESDLYEYLASDNQTEVVISYIESVADGRRFINSAKNLSEKKPFILLKSGKGLSGQIAAFSHTGRLAGRYEVFNSIMRQFGIKEVDDFDELIDAAKAISFQGKFINIIRREKRAKRVLIITNGGGSGVLAADECMRKGLDVANLPDNKRERLRRIFPYFYGVNNPIDLTAQVKDIDYITAIDNLKDDFDGFLLIALPNVAGITEGLTELIKSIRSDINKPIVFHIPQNGVARKIITNLERIKIPVYASPERAVRALKALLD